MQIMKRIAPLVLLGALSLCFSSTASAVVSLSNGFYGEGSIGYAFVTANTSNTFNGSSLRRDDGLAGGFILGYKFIPYLAIDVGYTTYPHVYISTWAAHVALKGIYPLGDGTWDVFAKAGAAYASGAKDALLRTTADGVFYYGAGFTYWFQPDFGALIQTAGILGEHNVSTIYSATVGLVYFFF